MNRSVAPGAVPVVTVDADDLAELILAVHEVATDIPRRFRRQHDNVVDIVGATVSDVRPGTAQRRYGLDEPPTAAFTVAQRGLNVDVIVEHYGRFARATFYSRANGAETRWPSRLAEHTQHTLLAQHVTATLS